MRREVFNSIYAHDVWNSESGSGPGSEAIATKKVAIAISALSTELKLSSVLNLGCGADTWLPELPGYVGVDISKLAIERATQTHPDRHYVVLDGVTDELPVCDLVMVRDCIQHLSLREGLTLLNNVRTSGCKWVLASTFLAGKNINIATGGAYSPDLEAPPFSQHNPVRYIQDGYSYDVPERLPTRDPSKKLALWRLT